MPVVGTDPKHSVFVPEFVVKLPARPWGFLGNLWVMLVPSRFPRIKLNSGPAPFWPDVFVKRGLPWLGFLESGAGHFLVLVLLLAVGRFMALLPQPAPRPTFDRSQVIYYAPSEYLPRLDTREADPGPARKADPEYSRQPIISVPRETDNREQTIVAPPRITLKQHVAQPNIVAWSEKMEKPRLAVPAAPLTLAADLARIAPHMKESVVAPPPEVAQLAQRTVQASLQSSVVAPPPELRMERTAPAWEAPQPAILAPPPSVENAPARTLGQLDIGRSAVIAPAPQLPVNEQRAVPAGRAPGVVAQVVPPPPSIGGAWAGAGAAGSAGRVIALNLHPEVGAPLNPPAGNRRGSFAATPEGHAGASGTPGSAVASNHGSGNSAENGSSREAGGVPAGLYVGSPPSGAKASAVAGPAGAAPTSGNSGEKWGAPGARGASSARASLPARPMTAEAARLTVTEREVFGGRRFYSLTLNMPNLNSAGGSWIVRFAELKQDPNTPAADLSQPNALRKVDPAYPAQLMRENVAGTVILYAVIRADGTVGNVRVLRGVDERLDRFAVQAVEQWRFQPAAKNGVPIDVEATFKIPFRPPGTEF